MVRIELKDEQGVVLSKEIPESWNELTRDQLFWVVSVFFRKGLTQLDARDWLIVKFLAPKNVIFNGNELRELFKLNILQFQQLSETLGWIFEEGSALTKQLIPSIRLEGHRYYGPLSSIDNCTAGEVARADGFLVKYQESQEDEALDGLIATLYRPRKWWWFFTRIFPDLNSGDPRMKFNDSTLSRRRRRIRNLKRETKLAILLFFQGCKQEVVDAFANSFGEEKEAGGFGMLGILLELAGTKFGTFEQTLETNYWAIMTELERSALHAKEMEENAKN